MSVGMAMGWTIMFRFSADVTFFASHRLHRLWGISGLLFDGYRTGVLSSWEERPGSWSWPLISIACRMWLIPSVSHMPSWLSLELLDLLSYIDC